MALSQKHREQLRRYAPDHLRVVEDIVKDKPAPSVAPEDAPEFVIDMTNVAQRLSVADIEDLEDATGLGIQHVLANIKTGRVKGLAALVWVLRRKEDPKFTLAHARAWNLGQLTGVIARGAAEEASADDEPTPFEQSASSAA